MGHFEIYYCVIGLFLYFGYPCKALEVHTENLDARRRALTDEQRLLQELMTNYDRYTRPVLNASHSVRVRLGITLNQIFDLDERNQVLTTHIWLDQEWYDEKLRWHPEQFNDLKTLRVPCHLIWKPDIILYNSADDYTTGYMQALAMVSHDGHVFWPPIVRLRSTCKIDITYFPFDDQTCSLKLGSWAYDGLQVDVLKRDKPLDLANYVSNGEWELINVTIVRNVQYYSCCPEPYPDVNFTLHIRRRTLYYTYNVIIPCIMLSCLTLLGFWIPPEGGEKVGVGLTVLLAFSVFMLLIAENMPATSFYIPLIGVYIIVAMGLSCVSVLFAVIVSYLHHQGNMARDVPPFLRSLALFLNRLFRLRMRLLGKIPTHSTAPNKIGGSSPSTTETTPDLKTPLRESYSSVNFTFRNECEYTLEFENTPVVAKENGQIKDATRRAGRKKSDRVSQQEDISRKLDLMLSRQSELLRIKAEYVNREWQEIAEVIDRGLFWFYVSVNCSLTVIILLLVPLGKSVTL